MDIILELTRGITIKIFPMAVHNGIIRLKNPNVLYRLKQALHLQIFLIKILVILNQWIWILKKITIKKTLKLLL